MRTTKWILDPNHSELRFKIKHMMISTISGSIKDFDVEGQTQDTDLSTFQVTVNAKMGSINTNNAQRDAHLQTSDFFEVDKFPELSFRSIEIEPIKDEYKLYGNLTIKGVTNAVRLKVEHNGTMKDPEGNEKMGLSITGKIKRSDWGMSFNKALDTGGMILGDEVKINSEIQLIKQVNTTKTEV